MKLFSSGWRQQTRVPVHDRSPDTARRQYRLESDMEGAYFGASIQAWWLPVAANCDGQVFQYIGHHGNKVTKDFSVLDRSAANDALNAWFSAQRPIPDSGIELVSARAELNVADEVLDFAGRKADIQRRTSVESADLEAKHAYLTRLRDLFLKDGGMARLWWLNGDPDRLLRLAEHTAEFDAIVNMIAGSQDRDAQPDHIAPIIDRFLTDLGPRHREYLIGQLGQIFISYEQSHLAEELRSTQT
jgi:hypothetical protein